MSKKGFTDSAGPVNCPVPQRWETQNNSHTTLAPPCRFVSGTRDFKVTLTNERGRCQVLEPLQGQSKAAKCHTSPLVLVSLCRQSLGVQRTGTVLSMDIESGLT